MCWEMGEECMEDLEWRSFSGLCWNLLYFVGDIGFFFDVMLVYIFVFVIEKVIV